MKTIANKNHAILAWRNIPARAQILQNRNAKTAH
jgi:hypothetical protein